MEDLSNLSTEELVKLRDKMKNTVDNASKTQYIDKYTKIDDLLRQNIGLQSKLIEDIELNNRLLYAIYLSEERGEPRTQAEISRLPVSNLITEDYKTLVRHFDNLTVSGTKTIFEVEASGVLAECKFQSSTSSTDNKTYGVKITTDNKDVIYNATWTTFESRNNYETDMTCYEDVANSYYILQFNSIAFLNNLKIEIYNSSATFTNIYIKYHQKGV